MKLVIVESPAKANTINKYLGDGYKVVASYGHVMDLPATTGSVLPENDFEIKYEVSDNSKKKAQLEEIYQYARKSEEIILATDNDREGEAIAWSIIHLLTEQKLLKQNTLVRRMFFTEITKSAILNALENTRDLDMNLVHAQQARRALDYLVGFTLSALLWRKMPGCRSAGRVQSVALRLICDRQEEIENFVIREYFEIIGFFKKDNTNPFDAKLIKIAGNKIDKFEIKDQKQAEEIINKIKECDDFEVENIEKKTHKRNPAAPFITSTLQQASYHRLGFSAQKTMQLAQKLYEGLEIFGNLTGLITYMRTDGFFIAQEALLKLRSFIQESYGSDYLSPNPIIYKSKNKASQEAHEAIRPTNVELIPEKVRPYLKDDEFKLYKLIWERTVACQMSSALSEILTVHVSTTPDKLAFIFRSSQSNIVFDGFLSLYNNTDELEDNENINKGSAILPKLLEGDKLSLNEAKATQHATEPPSKYSEASLVKKLEELAIGRPSTYANILSVIVERKYVIADNKKFVPEYRGRLVTLFLTEFFRNYVEYDFTAQLEEDLDKVASGNLDWKFLLSQFWQGFNTNVLEIQDYSITQIIEHLDKLLDHSLFKVNDSSQDLRKCPKSAGGRLSLKFGRFGPFLGCSQYPECNYTQKITTDLDLKNSTAISENTNNTNEVILSSKQGPVLLKEGPYGKYLQIGDQGQQVRKISLPAAYAKDLDPKIIEQIIDLPKLVGSYKINSDDNNSKNADHNITLNLGPYGAYLKYSSKNFRIPSKYNWMKLGLQEAIEIIERQLKKDDSGTTKKPTNDSGTTKKPTRGKKK